MQIKKGMPFPVFTENGKYVLIKKNRTKTQKSLRTLPLFANVEQMLLQMKFGNSYDYTDSEYVYVHENGKLIDPGYITQHFGIVLRNNGLRKKLCDFVAS